MNFDRKQRFSIRKYSIGVASVLIGSVLAGTTIASADTEVKIDDASKAPVTSTQEAPKVSAVSAQEASTQEAPTYSANAALVSTEKAEAPKVEAKTETPAKEQASQAEVKENAKDSKNEAKTEETVSEVKAPETEVKSEESEVKEAEKKADSTDKKSEDKPVDLKKEQLDVDKKVPGLDLKNATENPDGGFNIAFSKEAQEQYRASLEAYIARRRNYNRRSSFREAGAGTSENPDYEFKKVMTPILPGFYADKASIEALVVDPDHLEDFNFAVWYKKLGSVVLVDEQGNYITPTGEIATNQADAAHKQYENDPSDPTRAWFTKVPTAPTGWEVKPGQNVYGYDAARQTVNPNQKDDLDAIGRDTKIVIVKQAQKAIIKYVNENGNVELSRDEVVGKSGEAIDYSTNEKVSSYRRRGFELVSDGFYDAANKNFDFDASVDQEFTVVLRERIEPIDPDKPTPTPDKPVDPNDPDTPKWPDPVKDIVNKDDVTRTVKYVYEDGSKAKEDVSETLRFKRFAYVNLVTGHIDYRPWTTTDDTFDAVTSPVIKGYTADKLVVPAVSGVKAGDADRVEIVTYVKDAQKAIIKYVNEKGNVELSRDAVAGKSGEAIDYSTAAKISSYKRQGYELVSDGFTSASSKNFDFDASVDQEFTVVLRERIEPIDPDKPTPTPDKPVDPNDPDTPKWPDPVKDIVNKDDVTRTVKYVYEDGSKAKEDVSETLRFKRFAYVNLVTGHIDYRPWTTTDDTFDAVTSPVIKGYTADKLVVPAVSGVQAGAADTVEVVTYVKDAQKAIIKYVNEKGNVEVARDTVNGKSGEAIAYTTTNKINELHRKGYELVSDGFTSASNKNFDFDASVDQEFTVVVRERVVPVGPEDPNPTPDTPYDPTDPNTPNWPKNVDKILNRRATATRTVSYFTKEEGIIVPKPVRERVVFERIVLVNLVTGEMTPQAWKFVSATPISDNEPNTPRTRSRRSLADAPVSHTEVASLARATARTRSRRSLADASVSHTEVASLESVAPRTRSRRALADAPEVPSSGSYTFIKVPTPVTPGAYTKVKEVDAILYIPEDGYGSVEVDKNFAKKIQLFKLGNIQLVDQNGNVLAETIYKNNETDATKAAPTALPAIPAGYKIKEGQTVYGYDATAGTVDPNNPTDPDAIGRNTTILLELQAVPRQETKVVNETIHYKDAITGETLAPDHTDQVTFRRVVMVNPATNEVLSATSWVADNGDTTFDAVTSPVIEGYEASPLVVDAITGLTAESKDFVTTVLYRKKAVPTPQPDPVKPDPVKPDPVKPDPVKPDPVKPEPVKPNPVKPEPVKPEPTKPATPDAPKAPALPETGMTDASSATLLGAALGLVGLAGLAKRKRDENE